MTWTYDVTRDVLTVTYGAADGATSRGTRVGEALVYLDERGAPRRIELLRASMRHQVRVLTELENQPARAGVLAEAAARDLGLKIYALREEILSGGMPAFRVGQTWRIAESILGIYREILAARRGPTVLLDGNTGS